MFWMLLFFLFSYGMLHAYLFMKVQLAFRLPRPVLIALGAFLMLMVFSVILVHTLEQNDHIRSARLLGGIAYPWIALIFWFSVSSLTLDAWNLLMRTAARGVPWLNKLRFPPKPALCVVTAGVIIASMLGWREASQITVREINIQTPLLPAGTSPIRLAQISDLHLSVHRGPQLLRRLIDQLNKIHPDAIVSTGDLVDSDVHDIENLAHELATLRVPLGKYAVLGNHDFYAKESSSLAFHQLAGFRVLRQDATHIAPSVVLAGVDDPAGRSTRQHFFGDERKTLAAAQRDAFIILLKHQPLALGSSIGRFDLQLSGHVHDGQIFPFQWIVRLLYPHLSGTYRLGPRSLLNVSRGVGTWGPPLRLGARPEICVITLEPAAKPDRSGSGA